jgi:hypothetical protein
MSVVMVKCGNPLCRSEFGVADPDGVWETDQELAQGQGWLVDGALVACSGECLTLAQVTALVTFDAIQKAYFAAGNAVVQQQARAGTRMAVAAQWRSRGADASHSIEVALEHGLLAWSYGLERDQLRREAAALAGAA